VTVYVDDMYRFPMGRFGRLKMSHMIADSDDELHAMADKIGVSRRWFQGHRTSGSHYDIAITKRELALQYGARAVTLRQLGMMNYERRKTGVLPVPDPYFGPDYDPAQPHPTGHPLDRPKTTDRPVG
jgi:hypothetical protein